MPNPSRRSVSSATGPLVPVLLLCLLCLITPRAVGQEPAAPVTALGKQLDRIDFAISAAGIFGTKVSGIEQRDAKTIDSLLTIKPSNTVGELATLRYTPRPLIGFEFNFGNSRYTENFTFVPQPTPNILTGGAQSGVRELTLGYVAHTPKLFGIQPFLGAGGGTIRFKPTPYGGQGLQPQYRAAYYYDVGLEDNFPGSHFGARLAFRQLIYLAPDFGQNYLTITRRTRTTEPTFSFFLRF